MKVLKIVVGALLLGPIAAQAEDTPSAEHLAHREATHKACAVEEKSMCSDKHGREVFQCLRANNDKLGAGCKDALSKLGHPAGAPPAK